MKKRNAIVWGFGLVVLIGAFGVYLVDSADSVGKKNLKTCRSLLPGLDKQMLFISLGQPTAEHSQNGNVLFFFRTPSFMAGAIKAEVSESNGKVIALWCGQEFDPPNWKVAER